MNTFIIAAAAAASKPEVKSLEKIVEEFKTIDKEGNTKLHKLILFIFGDRDESDTDYTTLVKYLENDKTMSDLINLVFDDNRDNLIDYDDVEYLVKDNKFQRIEDIDLTNIDFTKLSENAYNNFISFIRKLSESIYAVHYTHESSPPQSHTATYLRKLIIQQVTFKPNTDICELFSANTEINEIKFDAPRGYDYACRNLIIDFNTLKAPIELIDIVRITKGIINNCNLEFKNLDKNSNIKIKLLDIYSPSTARLIGYNLLSR